MKHLVKHLAKHPKKGFLKAYDRLLKSLLKAAPLIERVRGGGGGLPSCFTRCSFSCSFVLRCCSFRALFRLLAHPKSSPPAGPPRRPITAQESPRQSFTAGHRNLNATSSPCSVVTGGWILPAILRSSQTYTLTNTKTNYSIILE